MNKINKLGWICDIHQTCAFGPEGFRDDSCMMCEFEKERIDLKEVHPIFLGILENQKERYLTWNTE